MYLVQLLLPLRDNRGEPFAQQPFMETHAELVERFGGITTYSRAPAAGTWKPDNSQADHDDLIVYEVMVPELDKDWWRFYRRRLETRFQQETLVVRAWPITSL